MTLDLSTFGFGISGKVPHDIVRELAPRVEQAGFRTMWFNHIPNGDALSSIAVAAAVTSTLRLATGVTSVDRMMPALDIVNHVRERDLPVDRLLLGIGANQPPSPLRQVQEATSLLHQELPGVPVIVGALGPKMRAQGVRDADGVLLNWLTPAAASAAMADARAENPDAYVALYIRTAMGATARTGMDEEIARYSALPSYAANFERLGFTAADAAVIVDSPAQLRERLEAYAEVVTEPVLRAITGQETLEAYVSLVDAARN